MHFEQGAREEATATAEVAAVFKVFQVHKSFACNKDSTFSLSLFQSITNKEANRREKVKRRTVKLTEHDTLAETKAVCRSVEACGDSSRS